jgi:hypothetical protein
VEDRISEVEDKIKITLRELKSCERKMQELSNYMK